MDEPQNGGYLGNLTVSFLPETEVDYVAEFQYPDGSKISVLIPKLPTPSTEPYGLNMVFGGHYV